MGQSILLYNLKYHLYITGFPFNVSTRLRIIIYFLNLFRTPISMVPHFTSDITKEAIMSLKRLPTIGFANTCALIVGRDWATVWRFALTSRQVPHMLPGQGWGELKELVCPLERIEWHELARWLRL